jgi:hypothetical protein
MIPSFSPKDPEEIVVLAFDFGPLMATGETITALDWTVSTAGTPALGILQGAPDLALKPLVRQRVAAGSDGLTYLHRAKATTDAGRVLVLQATQLVSTT